MLVKNWIFDQKLKLWSKLEISPKKNHILVKNTNEISG